MGQKSKKKSVPDGLGRGRENQGEAPLSSRVPEREPPQSQTAKRTVPLARPTLAAVLICCAATVACLAAVCD